MSDMPKEIWVINGADQAVKEIWQPDNVWGDYMVKYIRADLVPQWQPIETAPKDGTVIQGWIEVYDADEGRSENPYWIPKIRFNTTEWEHKSDAGWISLNLLSWRERKPTYWMPLPSEPTEDA